METVELSEHKSMRIAELPEDYRVVGVDGSTPVVRKPSTQVLRIQQDGRLVATTAAAKRRLADRSAHQARRLDRGSSGILLSGTLQ